MTLLDFFVVRFRVQEMSSSVGCTAVPVEVHVVLDVCSQVSEHWQEVCRNQVNRVWNLQWPISDNVWFHAWQLGSGQLHDFRPGADVPVSWWWDAQKSAENIPYQDSRFSQEWNVSVPVHPPLSRAGLFYLLCPCLKLGFNVSLSDLTCRLFLSPRGHHLQQVFTGEVVEDDLGLVQVYRHRLLMNLFRGDLSRPGRGIVFSIFDYRFKLQG